MRRAYASSIAQQLRLPRVRLAVASLCLLAQAFALVHLFAVRHVRCAEHGDMVHVEGAAHSAAHGPERATPPADLREASPTDHAVARASGLAIEAHQDDHCMALSERRDLRTYEVKTIVSTPELIGELTYAYQAPALVRRALFRLAPKISPPQLG